MIETQTLICGKMNATVNGCIWQCHPLPGTETTASVTSMH